MLGEGRRIATTLGATLYVFVPQPYSSDNPINSEEQRAQRGKLVLELGRGGADKIAMMPMAEKAGPSTWTKLGESLFSACQQIKPRVVLLAANYAGRDIASRLAARMRAALIAEPAIEYRDEGGVVLSRPVFGADPALEMSLEDIASCVVATLAPGACRPTRGDDEAEALTFDAVEEGDPAGIEYLDSAVDPGAGLDSARVIVVAGDGVGDAAGYALVGRLAEALGGELAATRALSARGIAPPERVIGLGARHVSPEIYIVCAASGSNEHLAAVSPAATLVAINSDPDAPIFRAASYGIVGAVEQVIPELVDALPAGQPKSAAT